MTISIFLILTLIEGIYIWIQYDKISEALDIAKIVKDGAKEHFGEHKKVKLALSFTDKVINVIANFKNLIWIPIVLLLIANMIVATVLGLIINIVLLFV